MHHAPAASDRASSDRIEDHPAWPAFKRARCTIPSRTTNASSGFATVLDACDLAAKRALRLWPDSAHDRMGAATDPDAVVRRMHDTYFALVERELRALFIGCGRPPGSIEADWFLQSERSDLVTSLKAALLDHIRHG